MALKAPDSIALWNDLQKVYILAYPLNLSPRERGAAGRMTGRRVDSARVQALWGTHLEGEMLRTANR